MCDIPRLMSALRLLQETQEKSYEWTLIHMQNMRTIIAAVLRLRRRIAAKPISGTLSSTEDDPMATLAPLVMPHLPQMLLASEADNAVAMTYLEDLVQRHGGAQTLPWGNEEREVLRDALEVSTQRPQFRGTWERAHRVFQLLGK